MERPLRGLDGVVIYLDDLIVTGHTRKEHLQKEGIRKDPTKMSAVLECPKLSNEVKAFFGLVNYFRKFIRNLGDL